MSEPRSLLNKILEAINSDVDQIVKSQIKEGKPKKLAPEDALTLTRYGTCLLSISEDREKEEEAERKRLAKFGDSEVRQKALEAIKEELKRELKQSEIKKPDVQQL